MPCHPAEISGVTLQIVVSFEERERKIHRNPAFFFLSLFPKLTSSYSWLHKSATDSVSCDVIGRQKILPIK